MNQCRLVEINAFKNKSFVTGQWSFVMANN